MLPVIIFAVVAIPLLVIGFLVVSRNRRAGEHPATETDADRERTEREFAEAERTRRSGASRRTARSRKNVSRSAPRVIFHTSGTDT